MSHPRAAARPFAILAILLLGLVAPSFNAAFAQADVPTQAAARDLGVAKPEDVGMSSERLTRLSKAMQAVIDQGRLAGITTMIARHGKVVDFQTFGYQNLETKTPMAKDTIFRIYSMSKPITGVALMTLFEEGKFRLSDPVEKHIPELAGMKVAASEGPDGPVVEDAKHPMTIRELMSHTGGLSYGIFSESQVDKMYRDASVLNPDSTLKDMIGKLAKIPLRQQPGTKWHYSVSVDVQGYLVEVLSGQPFDQYLEQRIFKPLGMKDTGFYVPEAKAKRFAQVYNYNPDGSLVAREGFSGGANYLKPAKFFSGGGGLVSTSTDYMRFCQMMLNGGELDGVRILSPTTVKLMSSNQLPKTIPEMGPGTGFGLDFAVVHDPVEAGTYSKGEYYWGGAAGTWFWIDPVEDLVFVGMIQQFGEKRPSLGPLSKQLTYQAILEPAAAD
jgi:CubicO group peptidase (beta-lactamase class C family)